MRIEYGQKSLLLMGDFNVTEREPAYHDLAEGLQDAYRQAEHLGEPRSFGVQAR